MSLPIPSRNGSLELYEDVSRCILPVAAGRFSALAVRRPTFDRLLGASRRWFSLHLGRADADAGRGLSAESLTVAGDPR